MKAGDRVRDKFKSPRPGDDSAFGVVVKVGRDTVTIQMDTGLPAERARIIPKKQFDVIFVIVDQQ